MKGEPLLPKIAEAIGMDAALRIAEARGGARVSIPGRAELKPDHWLVQAVGREKAEIVRQLLASTGAQDFYIPLGEFSAFAGGRRQIMRRMYQLIDEGRSDDAIARELRISWRTVHRARRRRRQEGAGCAPRLPGL